MSDTTGNKQRLRDFIRTVWMDRDLDALADYWTADCVNHAASGPDNQGLEALRAYHAAFFTDLAAFSDIQIETLDQIAEGDRVVTYLLTRGRQGEKTFSLRSIRIDQMDGGKIAEHWSVADMLGLMQQLQA